MSRKNRIRIYINAQLQENEAVCCDEKQSHYLVNVMRLSCQDEVFVFNGTDGEYQTVVESAGKKSCRLRVMRKVHDFSQGPDVWLMFAPLKKDQTDFAVTKAVELGAARIIPVLTEYTNHANVHSERLQSLIIEAAEQSRRQDVPILAECQTLEQILSAWPAGRKLIYLDETGCGARPATMQSGGEAPAAVLIGPEGGFSQKELEILRNQPYSYGVSLGTRILRAETAAVAALACWQMMCGDWR